MILLLFQEENFDISYKLLLDIQGLLVSEEFQANRKVFSSIGLNPRRPPRLLDWHRPCRHEILSRIWLHPDTVASQTIEDKACRLKMYGSATWTRNSLSLTSARTDVDPS